jgi:hypothetical protein
VAVAALRRLRSRRTAWLIAAQVALYARPAKANLADEDRVELSVAGGTDEARAFADALREPLQRLGVVVRGSSPAGQDDAGASSAKPPRARIWIDARPVDRIDIVIALGSSDAEAARRSVPRGEPEPVVVDQVAYVVRETLESLLWTSQGAAGVSTAPPATEPPDAASPSALTLLVGVHEDEVGAHASPRAPAPPGGAFGVDVSAFATGRALAPGADVLGAGASLDFTFWGHQSHRPRLLIAASYDTPFEATSPDVTLRVAVWSLRALPTVALLRWGAFGVDAGVGAGLEALNAVPAPAQAAGGPPIAIASPSTVFDPVATGQLMVWLRPTGGVGVLLGAYADYDLAPHRYTTLDRFHQQSIVVEPWQLRPAVIAGFCIPLTGTSACARPDLQPR